MQINANIALIIVEEHAPFRIHLALHQDTVRALVEKAKNPSTWQSGDPVLPPTPPRPGSYMEVDGGYGYGSGPSKVQGAGVSA